MDCWTKRACRLVLLLASLLLTDFCYWSGLPSLWRHAAILYLLRGQDVPSWQSTKNSSKEKTTHCENMYIAYNQRYDSDYNVAFPTWKTRLQKVCGSKAGWFMHACMPLQELSTKGIKKFLAHLHWATTI